MFKKLLKPLLNQRGVLDPITLGLLGGGALFSAIGSGISKKKEARQLREANKNERERAERDAKRRAILGALGIDRPTSFVQQTPAIEPSFLGSTLSTLGGAAAGTGTDLLTGILANLGASKPQQRSLAFDPRAKQGPTVKKKKDIFGVDFSPGASGGIGLG